MMTEYLPLKSKLNSFHHFLMSGAIYAVRKKTNSPFWWLTAVLQSLPSSGFHGAFIRHTENIQRETEWHWKKTYAHQHGQNRLTGTFYFLYLFSNLICDPISYGFTHLKISHGLFGITISSEKLCFQNYVFCKTCFRSIILLLAIFKYISVNDH